MLALEITGPYKYMPLKLIVIEITDHVNYGAGNYCPYK